MAPLEWSELIKNAAVTAAAVAGGGWAVWTWAYAERARRQKDLLAVDGSIACSLIPLTDRRVVATVESRWNNVSSRHIFIDPQRSSLSVYEVPTNKNVQALWITRQLGKPVISFKPYAERSHYTLEAGSMNRLTAHCVLDREKVYAIRWKLFRDERKHPSTYAWTKELIISTRDGDYNPVRPHSSLGERTPREFASGTLGVGGSSTLIHNEEVSE